MARPLRLPLLAALLLTACGEGGGASLQPIAAQSVRVNEILMVTIAIDNPEGRAVELRVEAPDLPMFDRVHSLSTEPGGAVFRWAPLSSHVGMHELTFVLTNPGGGTEYDRETALVEVLPSSDSAPIFVRPGAGGTYDVEREPCVTFDVEVRDDDSTDVDIGLRSEPPEGATLANAGPRRAMFDWCPTPDQIAAAERWTVQLYADDRDHPRVEHDYILVLRSGPKEGCPGAAPVVNVERPAMGEAITSGTSYPVEVSVSDDMGLRDAPLLYYTTTEPSNPAEPDVTEFMQATFEPGEGGRYVARIPPLGLDVGEMRQVWFLVSATDNDDPSGSLCDHRTDSPVVMFFAVGGMPADGSLRQCDFCSASTECASGICATAAGGARCVDACSEAECSAGLCGATVTTEGGTRAGCGPVGEICGGGGGGMCTDDGREDDDTAATGTTYASPIGDGQICPDDDDYFRVSVPMGNAVTVTVDGFTHADGDLDLELRAADGTILGTSASVRDTESVSYCNGAASTTLTARVFGFSGAQNAYSFRADVAPDPSGCCIDDAGEDDDARTSARTVTFASDVASVDGTICPGDDDWIAIPMTGPGRIEALVLFDHSMGDIDIALHDPSGTRLRSSVTSTDDEMIAVDVAGGGTYALRVYGFGLSAGNDWIAEITRSSGSSCSTSLMCPADTVCDAGMCRDDRCSTGTCPAMHTCVAGGPIPAAPRCGAACTDDAGCRTEQACKYFPEGRFCGRRGSGNNGDPCASFASCGAQRACLPWTGGYCARAGCTTNADCETGTWCVAHGGQNVCALSCVSLPCRESEGYSCDFEPTLGGTSRFVCLPGG